MLIFRFIRSFSVSSKLAAKQFKFPKGKIVHVYKSIPKMSCSPCSCKFVCGPQVDIDPSGKFKYILVQTYDENTQPWSMIVRGYKRHEWHNEIFDEVVEKFKPLKCEPLGGGKIIHKPEDKKIYIYGTSTGYGQANHEVTAKMIREAYPEYTVTVGEEPKEGKEKKDSLSSFF